MSKVTNQYAPARPAGGSESLLCLVPAPVAAFEISVRRVDGSLMTLRVSASEIVGEILMRATGTRSLATRLSAHGRPLRVDQTLAQAGVLRDSEVQVCVRGVGGTRKIDWSQCLANFPGRSIAAGGIRPSTLRGPYLPVGVIGDVMRGRVAHLGGAAKEVLLTATHGGEYVKIGFDSMESRDAALGLSDIKQNGYRLDVRS